MSSCSISDAETKATLLQVYQQYNYLLDPHGAVGYHALQNYLQLNPMQKGIVLETAHPVKFYDVVEPITGDLVTIPAAIQQQLQLEKKAIKIAASTTLLKDFLFSMA